MRDALRRILLVTFFVLTLIPILSPVFLSMVVLIIRGKFLYDFLMPMELFPFTLTGAAGVITISILKKKSFKKLLIYSAITTMNFALTQIYTNLSGLAHGDTKLEGFHVLVVAIFVILHHILAFLVAIESFFILRRLW